MRHAAIAIVIAAVTAAMAVLRPADIALWTLQAKTFSHEPSGSIVHIADRPGAEENGAGNPNAILLSVVDKLDDGGARKIAIDTPLRPSGNEAIDQALREKLRSLGDRVVLTETVREDFRNDMAIEPSHPWFKSGVTIASSDMRDDFLRFVWVIDPVHSAAEREFPTLWSTLVDPARASEPIYVDYSIDWQAIPRIDLRSFATREEPADIAGKSVVIGGIGREVTTAKIPGYGAVPATIIHILTAETAMRGGGGVIVRGFVLAAFGAFLLLGIALIRTQSMRRVFYGVWAGTFFALFVASAHAGWRVEFADALLIGVAYAFMRLQANYKRRHLYLDSKSGLPNFLSLRRDVGERGSVGQKAIVVAKITRLDAIFASLTPADQRRYLRQVASRLNLGDDSIAIYHDGGKYFGFVLSVDDYADLESHLEGLRAIVSQAVTVSERAIDVSLTLGVDCSLDKELDSRLSSAIAAADQAREAYRPVFIISDFETDSETWDYSLQARLEQALSEDRISIKLQPKGRLETGEIVGAEALARWVDEKRGEIPPAQFVLQCERAGRLDDLTRRVMLKSFQASRMLADRNLPAHLSVNVSAIQFVDNRIVRLVDDALRTTGANPSDITIEVTETARIEDFSIAQNVMETLRETGLQFSIDDFGIASANLEALYCLPFSEMKLDRLFVAPAVTSFKARAIVANTVRLASEAGLTLVAEGIEDRETFELLKKLGCEVGQGYYLGRPQTLPLYRKILELQQGMGALRAKLG